MAQTLFEKIWKSHTVVQKNDGPTLLYVDRHLVHEVTSPQAFAGLRETGRKVRRPDLTVATVDHNVPTEKRTLPILDQDSAAQIHALEKNCSDFGVRLYGMDSQNQGIAHAACSLLEPHPKFSPATSTCEPSWKFYAGLFNMKSFTGSPFESYLHP